ncbi:MAG: hypothetical protein M5U28_40725 [Sandaracinaceae bacterium]|nr:hypothetical protein [Sandaracinaceae bacterium]
MNRLAGEIPASFVAFDLLALGSVDLRDRPQVERRAELERVLAAARPPLHVTPATTERALAAEWFERFEGAGLDGVMAKPFGLTYQPKKRAMFKVKHARTCDCVVAGFRWHKNGPGELVGSLILRPLRRRGPPPPRRRHLVVHHGQAASAREGARAAARERAGGPPLGLVGGARGRRAASPGCRAAGARARTSAGSRSASSASAR